MGLGAPPGPPIGGGPIGGALLATGGAPIIGGLGLGPWTIGGVYDPGDIICC